MRNALISLPLPTLDATINLAKSLSACVKAGDVLTLQGDLGAGKTAFARALIQAIDPCQKDVPSPTFTLVQVYDQGRIPIWHFDLYRLTSPSDVYDLGIEEAFATALCLIEWPERLPAIALGNHLALHFHFDPQTMARSVDIKAGHGWEGRMSEFRFLFPDQASRR